MSLTLTIGQSAARLMVSEMVDSEDACFGVVTGYAGTGKTTLLSVIADDHGAPLVLTPTGKAALRVSEATGLEAQTIHRWLYKAQENPKTGELGFVKKPADQIELPSNGLIVIDEGSMVSESLWADVWGTASAVGAHVLLIGDRFQLPPVIRKVEGEWQPFSALTDLRTQHRAELTEVVRQALDNPIVRASMMVRESELQAVDAVSDVLTTVPESRLVPAFLALGSSRALIAHKNETRQRLNREVRAAQGLGERLAPGEPLLVLQNNYFLDRFNGEVVNFAGWVTEPDEPVPVRDRYKNSVASLSFGIAHVENGSAMLSEEEVFGTAGEVSFSAIKRGARDHAVHEWGYEDPRLIPPYLSANLGYCLTAHKSQGSEWDDVMVVAERSIGGRGGIFGFDGRRWLYTAITRARSRACVCFVD